MKLLLDTHAFLWFVLGSERFSEETKALVVDGSNQVSLSVASVWEIAIKHALGKLEFDEPFESLVFAQMKLHQIKMLHAEEKHFGELIQLPHHHRDPFDRFIIAQAKSDKLTLVTYDAKMRLYDIELMW